MVDIGGGVSGGDAETQANLRLKEAGGYEGPRGCKQVRPTALERTEQKVRRSV